MKTYFAEILLPVAVPNSYTYRLPRAMESYVQKGVRVVVPFGQKNKLLTGIVLSVHESPPSAYTAKYIDSLLDDKPVVTEKQIDFWNWMSEYYLCTRGEVLLAALPVGLRLSSESKYVPNPAFDGDTSAFTERETTIFELLNKREVLTFDELTAILEVKNLQPSLKNLLNGGAIQVFEDLKERYKPRIEYFLHLNEAYTSESGLQAAFEMLSRAAKQQEALMVFAQLSNAFSGDHMAVKRTVLQKKAGISSAIVGELIKKDILLLEERDVSRLPEVPESESEPISLNEAQAKALLEIRTHHATKATVLLHGVTSSGKTEIYIELIHEVLRQGKQVLFMLPEIALTTQMIARLQQHFGKNVLVYHSKFNQNERVEIWNKVMDARPGEGNLILGARSTVFLPFQDLGLVIIDEEHEISFKQFDPAPRYQARDAALVLAALHGAKSILGSATPSYETLYNARSGKYGYVALNERYGGRPLPAIQMASLHKKNAPSGYFTRELLDEIKSALDVKDQVILFQNRRGYAPVLICEMCGWAPECTQCDVSLTFHKVLHRLVCHYCGSRYYLPQICAGCGSHKLKLSGFGTERIEEEIGIHFPDAKIARLDLDSTRTKNAYSEILSDFEDGFIDILIGTQMVTKGLDFGKVNLVGILNADLLLRFPDFRATERAYQLMTQVAGRAGRREKRGKVIIQTYDPNQWVLGKVRESKYDDVAKHELTERRNFAYPPFTRLILLTFRHGRSELVDFCASEFFNELRIFLPESAVLGPEYPRVAKVKNKYNKNIILKIGRELSVADVKRKLVDHANRFFKRAEFRAVRLIINVDPQ